MVGNKAVVEQQNKQVFQCRIAASGRRRQSRRAAGIPLTISIVEGEFVFCLDEIILAAVEQVRGSDCLQVPRDLVGTLRQHTFWLKGQAGYLQPGLTFCSRYVEAPETCQALMETDRCDRIPLALRTIVGLDGDIIQQIRNDYLEHNRILLIANTHRWLINQLTQKFRISAAQYIEGRWGNALNLLSWTPVIVTIGLRLSAILQSSAATTLQALGQWLLGWFLSTALQLGLAWACKLLIRWAMNVLLSYLANWALQRFLSPDPLFRSFAKRILGRFIP